MGRIQRTAKIGGLAFQAEANKEVLQLQNDVHQLKEAVAKQSLTFEKQNQINAQAIATQFQDIKTILQNKENPPKKLRSEPGNGDSSL